MRRRYADRRGWRRLQQSTFRCERVDEPAFSGHVTRLELLELEEPLTFLEFGRHLCVADNGYLWMQHFPDDCRYTMTTMFDSEGNVAHWYIDIARETGIDASGVPWWDDLYLDVIALPSGEAAIIDGNELERALGEGVVTRSAYDAAWCEARQLLAQIRARTFPLFDLSLEHRNQL